MAKSAPLQHYMVSHPRMTVYVQTTDCKLQRITRAAPIVQKFVNQSFDNLKQWLRSLGEAPVVTRIYPKPKVLVCGGRDYDCRSFVYQVLDSIHNLAPIELLIHGDASGADSIADDWAAFREVVVAAYPADWKTHGKAAGIIRNKLMLKEEKPDCVVAFPGGSGTQNMISIAKKAGVMVYEVFEPEHFLRPKLPDKAKKRTTNKVVRRRKS